MDVNAARNVICVDTDLLRAAGLFQCCRYLYVA
jgi:hypothetical protein